MVCDLQRNLQSTFAACFHTCTDTFIKCYSYSLSNTCWLDAMFSLLTLLGVLPLPLPGITLLGSCSSSSTASPSYSNNVTWLWHVEHRNTTTGMAAWQARTAIHVTILEDVSRSKIWAVLGCGAVSVSPAAHAPPACQLLTDNSVPLSPFTCTSDICRTYMHYDNSYTDVQMHLGQAGV